MEKFLGSIAQMDVHFPIEIQVLPNKGEQYARVAVYISSDEKDSFLTEAGTSALSNNVLELKSTNVKRYLKGNLLKRFTPFFLEAPSAISYVCVATKAETALTDFDSLYEATKTLAYFKLPIADASATQTLLLDALLEADAAEVSGMGTLYNQIWCGINQTALGKSNLTEVLAEIGTKYNTEATGRVHFVYKYQDSGEAATVCDAALVQLGRSVAEPNATGTPVGNAIDMVQISTMSASGAGGANLSTEDQAALDAQKVAYVSYIGDASGKVAVKGSLFQRSNDGGPCGAAWLVAYLRFVFKRDTANYITSGATIFNDRRTYLGIQAIVKSRIQEFVTAGRLTDVEYTFPQYEVAVAAGYITGDTISILTAWSALFVDSVRTVTIKGMLYVNAPSR